MFLLQIAYFCKHRLVLANAYRTLLDPHPEVFLQWNGITAVFRPEWN